MNEMTTRKAKPWDSRLLVLCYHALADTSAMGPIAGYGMPLQDFEQQIYALRRWGFDFPSPDAVIAYLKGEAKLDRRSALITFDDAYANIMPGLKILGSLDIPSIVFAVSGLVGRTNEWDADLGVPPMALMSAVEMRAAHAEGVEFGVHSRTHPHMTAVDDQRLVDETKTAFEELSAMGVGRPRFFAYPHGDHDERIRKAVERSGIEVAFHCQPGAAFPTMDLFAVPRMEILRPHAGPRFGRYVLRMLVESYF
ncbi:polysaccharide deacetylase family protein [Alsobacter sp. R-9]